MLYPTWINYVYLNFIGPLLTALVMLYIYPLPARRVFEYNRKQQLKLRIIQQKIEDETPMTLEEGRAIRQEALKLELEFHSQLKRKDEEINDLKTMLIRLNEQGVENNNNYINEENTDITNSENLSLNTTVLHDVTNQDSVTHALAEHPPLDNDSDHAYREEEGTDAQLPPSSRRLFFSEFWKLDDATINHEAKLIIDEMQKHVLIDATEVITVMQRLFFLSAERIIDITTAELKEIFLQILSEHFDDGLLSFEHFDFSSRIQSFNDIANDDYKVVKEMLYKYKEIAYETAESLEVNEMFDLLKNNPDAFFKTIYGNSKYDSIPIFKLLRIDEISKTLFNSSPDTILKFTEYFNVRYRTVNISEYLGEDAQPLNELLILLEKLNLENNRGGTKGYAMKNFLKVLEGVTQRLSRNRGEPL